MRCITIRIPCLSHEILIENIKIKVARSSNPGDGALIKHVLERMTDRNIQPNTRQGHITLIHPDTIDRTERILHRPNSGVMSQTPIPHQHEVPGPTTYSGQRIGQILPCLTRQNTVNIVTDSVVVLLTSLQMHSVNTMHAIVVAKVTRCKGGLINLVSMIDSHNRTAKHNVR